MVTPGFEVSSVTVMGEPEEGLPALSVAPTVMVLLPGDRVTYWLKVPPTTGIDCGMPFNVSVAVLTQGSLIVPETVASAVFTTLPDAGDSTVTTGAVWSNVTVLAPEVPSKGKSILLAA